MGNGRFGRFGISATIKARALEGCNGPGFIAALADATTRLILKAIVISLAKHYHSRQIAL
jgi:hypothetical protein